MESLIGFIVFVLMCGVIGNRCCPSEEVRAKYRQSNERPLHGPNPNMENNQ